MTIFRAVGVTSTPAKATRTRPAVKVGDPPIVVPLVSVTVEFLELDEKTQRVLSTETFDVADAADLETVCRDRLTVLKDRHEAARQQIALDVARKTIAEVQAS